MLSTHHTVNTHQFLKSNGHIQTGSNTTFYGKGVPVPLVRNSQQLSSLRTRAQYGPSGSHQGASLGDKILQNSNSSQMNAGVSNKNPVFVNGSQIDDSNLLKAGVQMNNPRGEVQFDNFKSNAQSAQFQINPATFQDAPGLRSLGLTSKYFGFKSMLRSKISNLQALPKRYNGLGDFILSQDQSYSMETFLEDQKYCQEGVEDESCLTQYTESDFMDKEFLQVDQTPSIEIEIESLKTPLLGLQDFSQILYSGGAQFQGFNGKGGGQFQKPDKDVIVRSSCSGSIPTDQGYNVAKSCYQILKSGESTVDQVMEDVREEMMLLYDLPKGTGIFFASSSSNAQIIAFMIGKALNPYKGKFLNILTENEDQYSESIAADSKIFQYGEALKNFQDMTESQSKDISDIINLNTEKDTVSLYEISAEQMFNRCGDENSVPVVHKVYGSSASSQKSQKKEYLKYETKFIDKVKSIGGIVVSDCVRGELENFAPGRLLEKDEIVTITGSKFFRGPWNAEAVIVPESIMTKLIDQTNDPKNHNYNLPEILNSYMCRNDIPKELTNWRAQIQDNQDPGLALRWTASITEMHSFNQLTKQSVTIAQLNWAMNLLKLIDQEPSLQSTYNFNQDVSQHTVFQISMTSSNNDGSPLGLEDMGVVRQAMGRDLSKIIRWGENEGKEHISYWTGVAAKRCHVGKAVEVEESKAFITISLDSESLVRQVEEDGEQQTEAQSVFGDDTTLVQKLSLISQNFLEIKKYFATEEKNERSQKQIQILKQKIEQNQEQVDGLLDFIDQTESQMFDFLFKKMKDPSFGKKEFLELILIKDKSSTMKFDVSKLLPDEATIKNFLENHSPEVDHGQEPEEDDQHFSVQDTFAGTEEDFIAESQNVVFYSQSYLDKKNKYSW